MTILCYILNSIDNKILSNYKSEQFERFCIYIYSWEKKL